MNFQKIKDKVKDIAGLCGDFVVNNKRYFLAGCIFACMTCVLFMGTKEPSKADKSVAGVYKDFKQNKSNEIEKLITNYYKAYAAGDTDAIKKLADPVSDQEVSYIQFYSQYIESFDDIQVYTKEGLKEGSYLVSVEVDLKYKDIDTSAPGLDFFYVEKNKKGKYKINNIYGSFNQNNNIYEMDTEISDLISVFIRQQDLLDKEAAITEAYDEAVKSDANLSTFMTESLPAAIIQWNSDYQVQAAALAEEQAKAEEEAKAAEEAAAQAEAEAQAAAEAEAAAAAEAQAAAEAEAQEQANSYTGKINARANIREAADKNSTKIGSIEKGTDITIYGEEGDFYKVEYEGSKVYITKDAVTVQSADNNGDEAAEEAPATTKSYASGEKITLNSTANIRSKMDTSSSKIAVAYSGDTVEVVMSYAEGWTKVKYKNKEGYIRTDLLAK